MIKTGKNLLVDFEEKLIELLKKYHECFAYIVIDMPKIDPNLAYDKSTIDLNVKPI